MKKISFLLLCLIVLGCNKTTKNKDKDIQDKEVFKEILRENIEDRILNVLNVGEKKQLFKLILDAQDRSSKDAEILFPNIKDLDKKIDKSRELQNKYELEVYRKQSWWNDIDQSIDIANKIKLKISSLGITSGWL
jgi:hypothetical protein